MGLFEHKIAEFPEIREWVNSLDISNISDFLLTDQELSRMFLASGGSYSAASFAELLSVEKGVMGHAMTPFIYTGGGYEKIHGKTLLISASGANKDIWRGFESCIKGNNQKIGAVTLSTEGRLQKHFGIERIETLFDYAIPTGRDGFLSTCTVLAFYLILYRAFGFNDADKVNMEVSEEEKKEISDFVDSLKYIPSNSLTDHEDFVNKLEGVDSFFILYTAKSLPAAQDIESKFSEGALGNTQLADYRNFAHGRYNWFTQRPGQTGLICLQTPDAVEMSEEILGRLPEHVPIIRLRTSYNTPLGCIDLLIKEHYLCSALANRWGLDISRPVVPAYGKELYRM